MPLNNPAAARLALHFVLAATGSSGLGRELCAKLVGEASEQLAEAPTGLLNQLQAQSIDRIAAIGFLGMMCGSCGMCPRGQASAEELTGTSRAA